MRIAKIKNKYLFKSSNPNGTHDYLVYRDKNTKQLRAIQLTHIYKKDKKRFNQIKQNQIKKMNFKHRETPSGVTKKIYNVDVNGKPLDLLNHNINLNVYRKTRISKKQQDDILKFVGKRKKKNSKKIPTS